MKFFFYVSIILFFNSCSINIPPNEWHYKSVYSYNSYTKNFLSQNDLLADSDLKTAISYAKQSADLTTLAKIYLGKCALNISVGIDDKCIEFTNISTITNDSALDSYYNFITKQNNKVITQDLDPKYQEFFDNVIKNEYSKAQKVIFTMQKPISKLLCASIIKENLTSKSRKKLIDISSYNGYKKSVLFWLEQSKIYEKNNEKKALIEKKISILKSKY